MARHVRNPKLDSRAAREKLKPSGKPLYVDLGSKLHIGYRRGKRGGSWVLRRYVGDQRYVTETIAEADDLADADGINVLDYRQAQDAARERMKAYAEEARIASLGPIITVRDAIETYVADRDEREVRFGAKPDRTGNARGRLSKHVLVAHEKLSAKPLALLTSDDLGCWREGLQVATATVQRISNDFRAALNSAAKRHKAQLPPTIRDTIKDGLAKTHAAPANAREMQILPDADIRRLVAAACEVDAEGEWEGDLARLVLTLAATGARFSQVVRMTCADVQIAQKRLMIPVSRKGRGVKNATLIGIRVGDDVLAALAPATTGRKGHEPLFMRPHWRQAGVGRWQKGERGPWQAASKLTYPWAAIVAKAGLAPGTIPYALRHSSIVRGLRAGLPTRLVAALHDTSSAMIEAHYAAFIVDAMDELAARAIVPLTTAPATELKLVKAAG